MMSMILHAFNLTVPDVPAWKCADVLTSSHHTSILLITCEELPHYSLDVFCYVDRKRNQPRCLKAQSVSGLLCLDEAFQWRVALIAHLLSMRELVISLRSDKAT